MILEPPSLSGGNQLMVTLSSEMLATSMRAGADGRPEIQHKLFSDYQQKMWWGRDQIKQVVSWQHHESLSQLLYRKYNVQ